MNEQSLRKLQPTTASAVVFSILFPESNNFKSTLPAAAEHVLRNVLLHLARKASKRDLEAARFTGAYSPSINKDGEIVAFSRYNN